MAQDSTDTIATADAAVDPGKEGVGTHLTAASKAKANAVWEQLKSKDSALTLKADAIIHSSYGRRKSNASSNGAAETTAKRAKGPPEWMISLGMAPKRKSLENNTGRLEVKTPQNEENDKASEADKEDSRKIAAAALAAVKSAASGKKIDKVASPSQQQQPEDVNANGAKAGEAAKRKADMQACASSGLDKLLEQIGKKQKINILDKSKKDWGEFKDEKGLSDELEAYKKSGDKYLDKVAFLQRADLREYEKERDSRLAHQANRRHAVNYDVII